MGIFEIEEPLTIGQRGTLQFYSIVAGRDDALSNLWRNDFRKAVRNAQLPLSSSTIKRMVEQVYGCREIYKVREIEIAHARGPWLLSTVPNAAMPYMPEHDIYFLRITCDAIKSQIIIYHSFLYVGETFQHDCPDIIYKEIPYDRCAHMAKPTGRWVESTEEDVLSATHLDSKDAAISKFINYHRDRI